MDPGIDRVVVVSDDSVPSGGAASIALASIRLLRERDVPVTLLTGDEGANPDLREWGVDVVSLGGRHLLDGSRLRAAARGLFDPVVYRSLCRWIGENDTPRTIFHLHNWHKVLSPAALRPLARTGGRLVVSLHDFFLACPNGGYFNFVTARNCELRPMSLLCIATNCDKRHYGHKAWRLARHGLVRNAAGLRRSGATFLAVHEAMTPYLIRGGIDARAIRVMRNPVAPWRDARVAAERNRDVLFVGRLEIDKGVDLVASAAAQAGANLLIAGDGPLRDRLRVLCPKATLLGHLSRAELAEMAGRARLVVVPTRTRETFGLVALEAAASGIPVISSTSNLMTDEIVAIGAGIAFDPGDPQLLAEHFRRYLRDDASIEEMSERGFSLARALAPSEADWCALLLDLYRDTLRATATGRGVSEPDFKGAHALEDLAGPQPS